MLFARFLLLFRNTYDAYTFVLDSLFNMCPLRGGNQVCTIFSNEFMTKPILDSIGMNDTLIFYDHFHLKMNLEKTLLSRWIVLKSYIDLMFNTCDEAVLNSLYKQGIHMCKDSTSYVLILVKLME